MDKRALSSLFRERLRTLVARNEGGLARFARETGVDRSALSQFLDPSVDRLPRAETLRAIAEAKSVSADWLLGLAQAAERGQEIARSVEIETAEYEDGGSPLQRWRREALGAKLRYVPSTLPDMLRLPEVMFEELEGPRATARLKHAETVLDDALLGDLDIEIATPFQSFEDFARGAGIWGGLDEATRRRQLDHMAAHSAETYPRLRLSLYDGRRSYSAPFTVFGLHRVSLYFGRYYLVLTATEQVRAFARHFDGLVREAVIDARDAPDFLRRLASETSMPPVPPRPRERLEDAAPWEETPPRR
jgi:transcriptional regulator with XRE-family HTH domain